MVLQNLIRLQEIDSTNNYARGLIRSKMVSEGTVVLAYSQISGRGQGKNGWESQPGKNLTVSFILCPAFLMPEKQFYLSMVSALAAFDLLSAYSDGFRIKWPNDLYWENKKAGGILIENTFLGNRFEYSIIGFGINLNQDSFISDAPNPVSIKQITCHEVDIDICLANLDECLNRWLSELKASRYGLIRQTYLASLFRMKKWSRYRSGGIIFRGQIVDVDEYGRLMIEHEDEVVHAYAMKEVEFIL